MWFKSFFYGPFFYSRTLTFSSPSQLREKAFFDTWMTRLCHRFWCGTFRAVIASLNLLGHTGRTGAAVSKMGRVYAGCPHTSRKRFCSQRSTPPSHALLDCISGFTRRSQGSPWRRIWWKVSSCALSRYGVLRMCVDLWIRMFRYV